MPTQMMCPRLTTADILAEMSYLPQPAEGIGKVDDIDHLGNRVSGCRWWIACQPIPYWFACMERNVRDVYVSSR